MKSGQQTNEAMQEGTEPRSLTSEHWEKQKMLLSLQAGGHETKSHFDMLKYFPF